MRVEWTSYDSPVGLLTLVECEAGPLVIEYPNRAVTIKWAVRLRAAVPELHIAQGSCRVTSSWLNDYFAGSPTPRAFPRSSETLVRSLAGPDGRAPRLSAKSPWARLARTTTSRASPIFTPARSDGWLPPTTWPFWFPATAWWGRMGAWSATVAGSPRSAGCSTTSCELPESCCASRSARVTNLAAVRLDSGPLARSDSIDKIVPKHDLMACNTLCLPSISEQALAAGRFDPGGFF